MNELPGAAAGGWNLPCGPNLIRRFRKNSFRKREECERFREGTFERRRGKLLLSGSCPKEDGYELSLPALELGDGEMGHL